MLLLSLNISRDSYVATLDSDTWYPCSSTSQKTVTWLHERWISFTCHWTCQEAETKLLERWTHVNPVLEHIRRKLPVCTRYERMTPISINMSGDSIQVSREMNKCYPSHWTCQKAETRLLSRWTHVTLVLERVRRQVLHIGTGLCDISITSCLSCWVPLVTREMNMLFLSLNILGDNYLVTREMNMLPMSLNMPGNTLLTLLQHTRRQLPSFTRDKHVILLLEHVRRQ